MADLARFLELEGRALVMADSFSIAGTAFPRGTFFFPRGRNPDLDALLEEASLTGRVVPIASGRTAEGPDLGTDAAAPLRLPRLALLGGEGTSPPSFGAHWFFLERILDVPFDILNVVDAASSDLGRYDVIVLPSGSPLGELGDDGLEALESWIRAGGALVAIAGSARALAEPLAGVEEREEASDQDEEDSQAALERALRTREERELEDWMERTPGAILQVSLDRDHPLAFGAEADGGPGRTFVLSSGFGFEPSEDFESIAFFPSGLERMSGVISEGNLERLARSAWLVERELGAGKVTLFADDPLFRLFWFAGFQLLSNALLVAPAF
jgi:hypothetical protein